MKFHLTDYIKEENMSASGIKETYSPYALQQARNIEIYLQDDPFERKYVEGITIDGSESLDLDDALFAERMQNGNYMLEVHIADPTAGIPIFSPLDLEAIERGFSFYRKEGVINMYPPKLANEIFSLNEDGEKYTLSAKIKLDPNGEIIHFDFFPSIFKNKKRYNYENFGDDYLEPDAENHKLLHLLYEIAAKRRAKRKSAGGIIDFDESDRRICIGKKEEKYGENEHTKKIPHIIVEEAAILANICAARFTVQEKIFHIFRNHLELSERAFYGKKKQGHTGLALEQYSHFTSPIRRNPDGMLHRIIKAQKQKSPSPYTAEMVEQILHHTNIIPLRVETFNKFQNVDNFEIWGQEKIKILENLHGEELKTHHFKEYIRRFASEGKKMPKNMKKKIMVDMVDGKVGNWIWCLGIVLLGPETELKLLLKDQILTKEVIEYKKVISLLNTTKQMRGDTDGILKIEKYDDGAALSFSFSVKQKKIFTLTENYENWDQRKWVKYELRRKTVEKIFDFFL